MPALKQGQIWFLMHFNGNTLANFIFQLLFKQVIIYLDQTSKINMSHDKNACHGIIKQKKNSSKGEHSGLVVECLTRDRGAAGSSLTGVTVRCGP